MQCGRSDAKMVVCLDIGEQRGKQKFDNIGIKNSWRWEWMENVVSREKLFLFMRKIITPGVTYCTLCHQEINYSGHEKGRSERRSKPR